MGRLDLFWTLFLFIQAACAGSISHSLRHFYTAVWEPTERVPHFVAVGYVDNQRFIHYDSQTRKACPQGSWVSQVNKDDSTYWDVSTWTMRNAEQRMVGDLGTLKMHFNESRDFYTWQHMYGCELSEDGSLRAFSQYSFNGRDFITFDKETLTWTASAPLAQVFKRKLDVNADYSRYVKAYQETKCVSWLKRFLEYGKETLLRTEPPISKVRRKVRYDGLETHTCYVHGFYPKEIDVTWRKDGEVWDQETFSGGVLPNSDGTYHTWLSIDVDPKERDRYRCQVEHDGLPEPVVLAWEETSASVWINLGISLLVVAVAVLIIAGMILYAKRMAGRLSHDVRQLKLNQLLEMVLLKKDAQNPQEESSDVSAADNHLHSST